MSQMKLQPSEESCRVLQSTPVNSAPFLVAPLSETEKQEKCQCETILEKGLATFFEVGSALLTIREKRLHRSSHASFEEYCRERWNIGRSYAWRLIGAAERLQLLPNNNTVPRPSSEFQIRPFMRIEPSGFPQAWNDAVLRSKDGRVTSHVASLVIGEIVKKDKCPLVKHFKRKISVAKRMPPLGKVLTLLHDAKRRVEKTETEEALKVLEEIECILFSPED